MPDQLTREALQSLSDLKRAGVIPSVRPCCGQSLCVCEHAPRQTTLRDYAKDKEAYDRAIAPVTLRVLTTQQPAGAIDIPRGPVHTGDYDCPCLPCQADLARLLKRGPLGEGNAAPRVRPARHEREAA